MSKTSHQQMFYLTHYAAGFPPSPENYQGIKPDQWKLSVAWVEGYYSAAHVIIRGVVDGTLNEDIHGIPGVFLFRHYLELAFKFLKFHARWLKDNQTNARDDEIEAFRGQHSLAVLWEETQRECSAKIPKSDWKTFDAKSISDVVAEFDVFDRTGEAFRYHGQKFEVRKSPPFAYELRVSYSALLVNMERCWEILNGIDSYLRETHGLNEDYDQYLNSFLP